MISGSRSYRSTPAIALLWPPVAADHASTVELNRELKLFDIGSLLDGDEDTTTLDYVQLTSIRVRIT